MLRLRAAEAADVPVIFRLIGELADYERLRHKMVGYADDLQRHLFGEPRFAHALMADWDGEPAGFALYFFNYSTFLCRPGMYLEDLFVRPEHRGRGIGQALLGNPRLLIVDEPTAGLDPGERNRFYNLLSEIGEQVTVILSTHIVEDVRELCPRMAIISNGELVLEGAPDETLDRLRNSIWSILVKTEEEFAAVSAQHKLVSTKLLGGAHELRIHSETDPGEGFRQVDPELEDAYFLTLNSQRVN